VLGEEKEGTHIILVTRGTEDTLSLSDESRIKELLQYYQVNSTALHTSFYYSSESMVLVLL
jgi:hypothetical protein